MKLSSDPRADARTIWDAAVTAVRPDDLVAAALTGPLADEIASAANVLVLGGGKAGAGMAAGVERALSGRLAAISGVISVPAGAVRPLQKINLAAGRPDGVNEPTAAGVAAADEMLRLVAAAGPDDVALCLLSGGGSALLPAPTVSLADKQAVTRQLSAAGATIQELNAVRKHLSRLKGGRLAEAFRGRRLFGLIISDVVGDPLDVIASGPTVADPTTYVDALAVLDRYRSDAPAVRAELAAGHAETPKVTPPCVENLILGNAAVALAAAEREAAARGYPVLNLGGCLEGDTVALAKVMAGLVRGVRRPACLLSGGETTVTLPPQPGKGGRNQQFVLAMLCELGSSGMAGVTVLSGGTDGEDGPTDAAGASADAETWRDAIDPREYLRRADAYSYFEQVGGLLRSGLTGTNVMDVRVILCS